MSCCPETKYSFTNASTTIINYSDALRDTYGPRPQPVVYYWDGNAYSAAGMFTTIKMIGDPLQQIIFDHGGPATGIISFN